MTINRNALLGGAAAIALAIGMGPALAQDTGSGQQQTQQPQAQQQKPQQQTQTGEAGGETQQQAGETGMQGEGGAATAEAGEAEMEDPTVAVTTPEGTEAPEGNLLIATVGEAEIHEEDVMAALQNLPPQARQQPPQVLIPAVVNQLILRELVLEEARAAGLEEDPEVVAMVGTGGPEALEQALVQVWFERELADRVTEEDIQAAYEDLQEANPDMDQELAAVRPQIQQMLQRQAAQTVGAELRQDAEITFYDEAGDPVEMTPQGAEGEQQPPQAQQQGEKQQQPDQAQ